MEGLRASGNGSDATTLPARTSTFSKSSHAISTIFDAPFGPLIRGWRTYSGPQDEGGQASASGRGCVCVVSPVTWIGTRKGWIPGDLMETRRIGRRWGKRCELALGRVA